MTDKNDRARQHLARCVNDLIQATSGSRTNGDLVTGFIGFRKARGPWGKLACVASRRNLLKAAHAISEPHDCRVRANHISPDQVGITVVVEVVGEERTVRFRPSDEMKPEECTRVA